MRTHSAAESTTGLVPSAQAPARLGLAGEQPLVTGAEDQARRGGEEALTAEHDEQRQRFELGVARLGVPRQVAEAHRAAGQSPLESRRLGRGEAELPQRWQSLAAPVHELGHQPTDLDPTEAGADAMLAVRVFCATLLDDA